MRLLTFKRGVHPSPNKHYTEDKKIQDLLPKGLLVYPMAQHIGAPCVPVVQKGDRVLVGQKIGEAKGFVSSPVHSSVSGIVKDIAPRLIPGGTEVLSVIVENDGKYEEHESLVSRESYKGMSKEELVKIIQEAGIVGLGGATFPTHVKLSPPPDKKIDTIIINGAECEPYITSDHRLMLEQTGRVVEGLRIILQMFPGAKGYIGIENNKMNAVQAMSKAVEGIPDIEVKVLKTKYPQGSEKHLIYSITGREVPSGKLPADVGCIVQNVDTAVAIERAVLRGKPVMRRIVTLSGGAINNPGNFNVKIGTTYKELVEAAGGLKGEPAKIICGGPMMGTEVKSLDVPVTKGTSAVLFLSKEEAAPTEESDCIRCGKCVQTCPMGLVPSLLNTLALKGEYDEFEKNHGMDCIECGGCSFGCPAKRYLVESFRVAKQEINKKRKAKK